MEEKYGNVDLSLLEAMGNANGIPGCEKNVSKVMRSFLEDAVDEITYDNLGSLIAIKKGKENGLKIMLAGHMDEVGFLVKSIDEQGYIRLTPVGGWWGHVILSQGLIITTRTGKEIYGVVGCRAPHGLPADVRNKVLAIDDVFLDLGVKNKEEVLELGVNIGDMVTPDTKFKVMNNENYLMSKAWDNRAGACIVVDVMRQLKNEKIEATVYGVGTTQEEVGLRGATTAANLIKPDIAFGLDVTLATDMPNEKSNGVSLGVGVVLSLMDASVIAHRGLVLEVENLCKELGLSFTYDIMTAGGTDTGAIHKAHAGTVAMTLSIPSRYIHAHRSLIHRKDYADTVTVLVEFIKRLNNDVFERIQSANR